MRTRTQLSLAMLALLARSATARAQSTTCNTGRADTFTTYTVSTTAPTIPTPTQTEFTNAVSGNVTVTVTIQPTNANKNRTWYLCISSTQTSWTNTTGYAKPRSDLQYSNNGTTWYNVGATPTQVQTSSGSATVTLYLRCVLLWTADKPNTGGGSATYSLPFKLDLAH